LLRLPHPAEEPGADESSEEAQDDDDHQELDEGKPSGIEEKSCAGPQGSPYTDRVAHATRLLPLRRPDVNESSASNWDVRDGQDSQEHGDHDEAHYQTHDEDAPRRDQGDQPLHELPRVALNGLP